jgi:hypothetical protein
MSYQLNVKDEGDFLRIAVAGVRTREAVLAIAGEIIGLCVKHQRSKVLVDVQTLTGRLSTLDAFEIPALEFPHLKGKGVDQAAIVDLEEFEHSYRFFEDVAANRGYNLRIFGNVDDAAAWLRGRR